MTKIVITYKDYIHCKITGLSVIDSNMLVKKFQVFNPAARYMPAYKLGRFSGYINYFQLTGQTYINLLPSIISSINLDKYDGIEWEIPNNLLKEPKFEEDIDENFMSDLVWEEGHRLEGQPIILEEHQVRCANALLRQPRGLLSSCTGSGKTLLCAALIRKIQQFGKIVFIVPYKDLCFQTAKDFKNWGLDVGIVGAGLREFGHNVTICMWQTINSIDKKKSEDLLSAKEIYELTNNVVCVTMDECHCLGKSNVIKQIMEKLFSNVPLRYGLTGTIPKADIDYMNLLISIGPKIDEEVRAKELQDKGFLSNCEVNCIRLEDALTFMNWTNEKDYLSSNEDRLKFIANFITSIVKNNKNTLVLIDRIKMGEELEKLISNNNVDVIFLSGKDSSKKRFEEYNKIKTTDNKCIIAIDKIASTGLNIPRLFNLVFIDYGLSFTKVWQSCGRGLRKASDKDFISIYDISSTTKYSRKHFNERIKYYKEAEYPFKIFNIDKWK